MQHPRHADVLDVEVLACHLGRDVDARHRLADDLVLARGLRLRPAEREPEPAGLRLDRNRHAEQATVDELAVGDAPRSVSGHAHDSILDGELVCRDVEVLRCQGQERPPSVGCGLPELRACEGDRQAAHGRPLVDACRGVAHDHADASEGHVELLGDDLRERRLVALAEIRLAGEGGDRAVAVDREPRVERRRIEHGRPRRRRVAAVTA